MAWLEPEEIVQVETSSSRSGAMLMKTMGNWIFADAIAVPLRKDRLASFIEAALSISAVQLVESRPDADSRARHGIREESFRLALTDKHGRTHGALFGRLDSKEGFVYALRLQDESLWALDFKSQAPVFKFRRDFEERRLLPQLADKTARFSIEQGGKSIAFRKTASAWEADVPSFGKAIVPPSEVASFLLAFQEMESEAETVPPAHEPPRMAFRFFEAGAASPFAEADLLASTKREAGRFRLGGMVHDVDARQMSDMETQMLKLLDRVSAALPDSPGGS